MLRPFIDGTVEGININFPDSDYTHTLTYYGNGCPNNGGTGQPGATKACDKRILKTLDDEYQENGTYYNFQAVTDGTGAAIQTDNANAPDSFCPLGWQLPYGGTGGDYYNKPKSWEYLFVTAYNYDISQMQQTTDKIRSYPHSFIMTGYYNNYSGAFYEQGADGLYSSSTSSGQQRYTLFFFSGYIVIQYSGGKNNDYPVRCVNCFSILSSTARWKELIYKLAIKTQIQNTITLITEMAARMYGAMMVILVQAQLVQHE